jgi:hypothetical protein
MLKKTKKVTPSIRFTARRDSFRRIIPAMLVVVAVASIGIYLLLETHAATPGAAPASPTSVCGQGILDAPYSYAGTAGTYTSANEPAGLPTFGTSSSNFPSATSIIVIAPGNNTATADTGTYQVNNAIVYFEPGTHDIENGMYTGHNSIYIGGYSTSAGKAILTGVDGATNSTGEGGQRFEESTASSGNIVDNTWEYLTVENYTSTRNNSVMGNVNGGGNDIGDTYKYDTIGPNEYGYQSSTSAPTAGESSGGGYAIDMGGQTTVQYNCLMQNAQGAFNGSGLNNNISDNEISQNGLGEYPDDAGTGGSPYGCGCSGGGKLNFSVNAVVDNNYVHDNYNTGIWLDFDNTGADISGNYIASNWGNGIMYEASYNANISDNTLVGNGWASDGAWPPGVGGGTCYGNISCTLGAGATTGAGGGNPYAAIDLSDSGGTSNLTSITVPADEGGGTVSSNYNNELLVQDNVLTNNFGGVKVYTDTNRYPGNIDNDSACSVPFGSLNQSNSTTYYRQTKELTTSADSAISGTAVTSSGGTKTVCADYTAGQSTESDSSATNTVQAPSVGMAVFDQNSGKLLGTIASVTSANNFTLSAAPGNETGGSLMISAYGGCGPADYYGGGPGVATGTPSADYWDNCIWGSRNVKVSGNSFTMNAGSVSGCNTTNLCGYMLDEAFNAGVPTLMQFFDDYTNVIGKASGGLGNVWSDNTYTWTGTSPASWQFWDGQQGDTVSLATWQSTDGQDAGSTFNASSVTPPSVPNSVTATATSPTSVSVTWTASTDSGGPGLGGYYILRNGTKIGSATASATTFTDSTASANTAYSYTVEAYDTAGPVNVSGQSTAALLTTPAVLPTAPTTVYANGTTYGSVTVTWVASTDTGGPGLSGYHIYRDGTLLGSVAAGVTTFKDTTASASTTYSYTVKAYDSSGALSNVSNTAKVTTVAAPAQAPTVSLTSFTNNTVVHGNSYSLATSATPASGTTIASVQLLVDSAVVQTLTAGPYTFTLSLLNLPEGDNTVTVKATDSAGNSTSNSVTAVVTNGDLNGDGKINISDLIVLAQNYGKTGTYVYTQGNITGSSSTTQPQVGLSDLIILAKNYGYNDGLGH